MPVASEPDSHETFSIAVEGKLQALLLIIEGYKAGVFTREELIALLVDLLYQGGQD